MPASDRLLRVPGTLSAFDHRRYVSATMEFRCNLRCTHCMIEDSMHWLSPQSEAQLQAVLDANAASQAWDGLILTGAEITLNRNLPSWAQAARAAGFRHVRIQTHGMRLADAGYCDELVAAGVDEFFISVCAADETVHDAITRVPGSFAKTMRGLENLERHDGIRSLTNTVMTVRSVPELSALARRLRRFSRLVQMEFWGYFPMRENDGRDLLVSHLVTRAHLIPAIEECVDAGLGVEVKNYPQCLLGRWGQALYNDQPQLHIDAAFWGEFARNGFYRCPHKDHCASAQCLGINQAYEARFGDHVNELAPIR